MGKKTRDLPKKILTLVIPIDLLPPASDELRWKALRVHCKSFEPLCVPPPEGVVAWPPMGVPAVDLFAYARGDYKKLTPRFMFFRKVLLLLVGEEDMLRSVVETGACTGRDVMHKWNAALRKVLLSAADIASNPTEVALYRLLLDELATGQRIQKSRHRATSAFKMSVFFLLSALLSYRLGWVQPLFGGGESSDSSARASTSYLGAGGGIGDSIVGSISGSIGGGGSDGAAPSAETSLESADPWEGQGSWHDLDMQQG